MSGLIESDAKHCNLDRNLSWAMMLFCFWMRQNMDLSIDGGIVWDIVCLGYQLSSSILASWRPPISYLFWQIVCYVLVILTSLFTSIRLFLWERGPPSIAKNPPPIDHPLRMWPAAPPPSPLRTGWHPGLPGTLDLIRLACWAGGSTHRGIWP